VLALTAKQGTGIKELKKKLVEVALELPYMPEEIPKSYLMMEVCMKPASVNSTNSDGRFRKRFKVKLPVLLLFQP